MHPFLFARIDGVPAFGFLFLLSLSLSLDHTRALSHSRQCSDIGKARIEVMKPAQKQLWAYSLTFPKQILALQKPLNNLPPHAPKRSDPTPL